MATLDPRIGVYAALERTGYGDADLVVWAVDPAAERGDGSAFRYGHATLTVVASEVVMQQ